jgi:hypothetical protein
MQKILSNGKDATKRPPIYIINVLSRTWSRSCKHFVAKLGTAGILSFLIKKF